MFVVLAILALAIFALNGWLIASLYRSHDRIATRLESLAHRSVAKPAAIPPARVAPVARDFSLPALDGRMVSLRNILATGKRTLINFTDPKCSPCYELLSDVGGWERVYGERLTIVTVSGGDVRQNQMLAQDYGLGTMLLQREHEIADTFGLSMLPSAVLIEPDGRIVDTAIGAPAVRQLVASALGLALPPQQVREIQPLKPGQPIGNLRRPDLDGNLVDLGELRPEPALLLFWSPGCTHCRDLLPAMREWDATPDGPRMLVVTSGPASLNREVGLRAPMIQDDDGVLKRTFGVPGTPAAVLIDGEGRVVSDVARGATGVHALGKRLFGRPGIAA